MRITFVISLLMMFSTSVWSAPGKGQFGFSTLTGAESASFQVPANTRLVSTTYRKASGLVSERYQQMVGDAEVLGGQLTVLSDTRGTTVAVIGARYPGLMPTSMTRLKGKAAQGIVASNIGEAGKWETRLMINPSDGRYFYIVENNRPDSRWFYWIDAEDGSIVNKYNGLTTGSGLGVQGDTKDLTGLTIKDGNRYEMISIDTRQTTYDAKSKNFLPGTLAIDDDDNWNTPGTVSPAQPAMVDAQFFAKVTDEYYLNIHGFNWLEKYPQGMVSSAHVKRRYNNAYWNGSQMAYGDGDGSTFINFSGDLDVVGHELTHGVTEASSDLIYQNEPGALNESFSDIMGTNIEFANGLGNWTIGEDITVGTNGIRNMADPNEDGDPSHYDDRYTGTSDNGGVHINSGIVNHWYYLLVNGGQNANTARATGTDVTGIGITAAEQVVFLGFTSLNATADFCNARAGTLAVSAIYKSGVYESNVADAWDEVGITHAMCSGGDGGSSETSGGGAPKISNVSSKLLRGTKFQISWDTDVPATSEVIFTCCGTYTKTDLVTNHAFNFNGSKGYVYEYYVTSSDGNGNSSTDGPYYHQN